MARSIWTGALSVGLVNVPVKLFSAVEDRSVHFHQFQEGTDERIRYRRVAESSGEEVPLERIVNGYEVRKGQYVMVTPDELESVEPERSRAIELEDFVDLDDIDPIYFQRTYYAAPADDSAVKPFVLLHRAMTDANRAGIARFVMRQKQHLAAVRPGEEVLLVETMHFADEVRDPARLDEVQSLRQQVRTADRERRMATQLIETLTTDWDPTRYPDTHRERVLELIEAKARGEEVVTERPQEPAKVVDLMGALEESMREARQRRGGDGKAKESKAKRGRRLSGRSRDELYEEAQRRDIAGRSKMSKDQLVDALREAS